MYKVASDKHQRALHRGRPADWANGTERLFGEDLLRQLQDETRILHDRIKEVSTEQERKALGLQRQEVNTKISNLKKSGVGKKRPELPGTFMQMAREMLPKVQYELIYGAARREFDRRNRELDAAQNACGDSRND